MSNCAKHKKEVAGISDMKDLANKIASDKIFEACKISEPFMNDNENKCTCSSLSNGKEQFCQVCSGSGFA